jgi:hypothetical protein
MQQLLFRFRGDIVLCLAVSGVMAALLTPDAFMAACLTREKLQSEEGRKGERIVRK